MKNFLWIGWLIFCLAAGCHAQNYPLRPVRLITPFAAGGDTDIVARILAQKLAESFGHSVVVDNRSGSNGILGTEMTAKSPRDGHTILMISTGLVINPILYRNLPYDALRDFTPISLIATAPHMLAAHPSVPVKTVKELIAYAKANPDKLSYSSGGSGASSHLSGAMFNVMAGTRMLHVPFRGSGPAALAAVGGEVSLIFQGVLASLPHVKSARLNGLATTGARRLAVVSDLPTIAEAGLPGFESGGWFGVLAPTGIPKEILERLNGELVRITRQSPVREKLTAQGSDVIGSSPEQFAEFIRMEITRWGKVIKDANIRID